MKQVFVIPTGVANLASVVAGLKRAGAAPQLAETPADVARAERVVLPGVGAFAPAIAALNDSGYAAPLRERIAAGRPTLGICLGMQVVFDGSEESPGVSGLGVAPGTLRRFAGEVRVPQLGWNRIEADPGCRYLRDGCAYFANSYRLAAIPPGWKAAQANHGGPFIAALEHDDVLLCQFHPELSGRYGAELLQSWIAGGASC